MASAQSSQKSIPLGPLGPWLPPRFERHTITPAQAQAILDGYNDCNRPIVQSHARRIADSIARGHFLFTGAPIQFDVSGRLQNGQHRLLACVLADCPIDVLVVFGNPTDAFQMIDQMQRTRNLGDILAIDATPYSKDLAAAIRIIHGYETGIRGQSILTGGHDPIVLLEALDRHPDLSASVVQVRKYKSLDAVLSRRVAIATHYLFGLKANERRDTFFDRLEDGVGLPAGSPILCLRQRLYLDRDTSKARPNTGSLVAFIQFQLLIRSWNHFRAGNRISRLQLPTKVVGQRSVLDDLPDIK